MTAILKLRLRFPRGASSASLAKRVRAAAVALRVVRGRITSREAVLEMEIEGAPGALERALQLYRKRGIAVHGGDGLELVRATEAATAV